MNIGFEIAFSNILKAEGSDYTDIPGDLGGPTKYGITQKSWVKFNKDTHLINITEEDAKFFYLYTYWIPMRLDEIKNYKTASIIMDQAVNRGIFTVVKQVQISLAILGLLYSQADGIIGDQTISALNKVEFKEFGLAFFKASQESYIKICQANQSQLKFLLGWIRRTHAILDEVTKE